MTFWFVAAIITFAACAAVLWPFRRSAVAGSRPGDHDVAVYRDQLEELERDAARGMVPAAAAQEARAEIGRRLLKASELRDRAGTRGGRVSRIVASAALLSIPVVAWGGYALTGSPGVPDQRLAERLTRNPTQNSVDELVARAEQHLAANPSDGRGWEVLAPIYMRTGRSADAVTAWRNAIRLSGSSAVREAGLGEALTATAAGVVTAEAQDAFERALAQDQAEPRSRFFLAMAALQEGKRDEAAQAWRRLADELPADSPWQAPIGRALASLVAPAQPGPDADQIAAAEAMSADDRRAMIEGMVASLDARLRDNPGDAEGWRRLVRSHQVLGDAEAAREALGRGVAALGAGTVAAAELLSFAASLGVQDGTTR